jgi:ParB-like chromosome segregation protein Spo0J
MAMVQECERGSVTSVPVCQIRLGRSPRHGNSFKQIAALAELAGEWEPIVVHRSSMMVVDGHHRLAAARRLGHEEIRVIFFEGTDAEARVEAVRLNVRHGVPLSLAERLAAARQLLGLFPTWSDRQLGEVCALSPRTVSRIRTDLVTPMNEVAERGIVRVEKRLGKDGRQYPRAAAALRTEIKRVLQEDEGASLRSVAARTGASPETVRAVRRSLAAAAEETEERPLPAPVMVSTPPTREGHCARWLEDSACSSTPEGRTFAQWFEDHRVDDESLYAMADAVPLSRIYEIIDDAQRRVTFWSSFADALQCRVSKRSATGS